MSIERKTKSESIQQLQAIIELRDAMVELNRTMMENKKSSLSPQDIWKSTTNYLRKRVR